MNIFFHKVEIIVNSELGQGGNAGLRAKDGFSIYDLIFEYIYGIEQMNLAACGGTFLTGLTRLTRFSLHPEHPVYPV